MLNASQKTAICVMAKLPVPGEVKTRLSPAVGVEGAALLAQAFLEDTLRSVSQLDWALPILACTGFKRHDFHCEVWPQEEGGLGIRQENVLRRALEVSTAAILIGSDCPGLPISRLESARDALEESDAVLGPSHDGGYYLIGLKRCPLGLLSGVAWSQADTFNQVISRLRDSGMLVTVIEPWFDVDTPEDLASLSARLNSGEIIAPSTAAIIWSFLHPTEKLNSVRT
ncbi:MAG: TIGR04282 family arsenosugar biosynthesis glycosyltransferase [Acidobacteriaceae bacterium]